MKLNEIMQSRVVTVDVDSSLWEVKMIFENTKFHHLLVTEDNKLVGIISDRDYLKAASPNLGSETATSKDLDSLNKRANTIMTRKLHTLHSQDSILDAIALFNHQSISCIPIVNSENTIEGIISWRDIMKMMYRKIESRQ
jgi:acetoin utilization protein AcuB